MADGGGCYQLDRAAKASLIAHAVIASARAYGDDPVWAMTVPTGKPKRCLAPAVVGLAKASGQDVEAFRGPLGVGKSTFSARLRATDGPFTQAALAAEVEAMAFLQGLPQRGPKPSVSAVELPQGAAVHVLAPARRMMGPRTITAGAARAEVRDVLQTDNATAPEIASAKNLPEPQVREALRTLAELGEAKADPMTAEGWRVQTWRWVRP